MLHNTGVPATRQPTADSARPEHWRPCSNFRSAGFNLCNFTSTSSCVHADVHGALVLGPCAVWVDYTSLSPSNTNRQWSIYYIKDVMTCLGNGQAMVSELRLLPSALSTTGPATFTFSVRVTCTREMLDLVHLTCVQSKSFLLLNLAPLLHRCCIFLTGIGLDDGHYVTGFLHAENADAVDPQTLKTLFPNCQRTCELCHRCFDTHQGYSIHKTYCRNQTAKGFATGRNKSVYLQTHMFALGSPVTIDVSQRTSIAKKYLFVCGDLCKGPFRFGGLRHGHDMRISSYNDDYVCIQYPAGADFEKYSPTGACDEETLCVLKTDVQLLDKKYGGCIRYLAVVHSDHLLQDSVRYALMVDLCDALESTTSWLRTRDVVQLPERHTLTFPLFGEFMGGDSALEHELDNGEVVTVRHERSGWLLRVRRETTKRKSGGEVVGGALHSHVEPDQRTIDVLQQARVPNPQLLSVNDMKVYIALIKNTVPALD